MSGPDLGIPALEERACNAWPALQSQIAGGWLLRFAEGYTKRANSACALPGATGLSAVLPDIEDRYARAGIPCCIRMTPLAPADAAATLDARGWTTLDETSLQVVALDSASTGEPGPGLALAPAADAAWIDGYAAASARPDLRRDTLARMLQAIGTPATFATVRVQDEPVAYGMAVLERGAVGLFDIATVANRRGRGHGRAVVAGLIAWGRAHGAAAAYLQVTTGNGPALALYGSLGFREVYRYVYRVPS
jgi:ribosomal protein S18 acetylase RimI-like enzyme